MKNKLLFCVSLSVVTLLTGCMTPEERILSYKNQCAHMGYVYNSTEMTQCVERLHNQQVESDRQWYKQDRKRRVEEERQRTLTKIFSGKNNDTNKQVVAVFNQ